MKVVVTVGVAVTAAVFAADKPVDGVQLYMFAPEAVNDTEDPVVIEADDGDTAIVGSAFTNTSTGCVTANETPIVAFLLK